MIDAKQLKDNTFVFTIDSSIFSETILSKLLYWYTALFNVFLQRQEGVYIVKLIYKNNKEKPYTFTEIKNKFNQDLIDFKNRDIIAKETQNIRDILYIKAFSNNDEFDDIILK